MAGRQSESRPADDAWLNAWVEQWGDRITQFAYTYTGQRESAQDVAQETFLRLFRWHAAHPDRSLTPGWLYTVAAHIAVDWLRRERHQGESLDARDASPGDLTPNWDRTLTLRDAMGRLSEADRECIWLFYYADWSIAEVGAATHQSPAAVKQRLFRARKQLARLVGGDRDGTTRG
jgi:RNA polymerase sigma-70 factor (ECF subfamily)